MFFLVFAISWHCAVGVCACYNDVMFFLVFTVSWHCAVGVCAYVIIISCFFLPLQFLVIVLLGFVHICYNNVMFFLALSISCHCAIGVCAYICYNNVMFFLALSVSWHCAAGVCAMAAPGPAYEQLRGRRLRSVDGDLLLDVLRPDGRGGSHDAGRIPRLLRGLP